MTGKLCLLFKADLRKFSCVARGPDTPQALDTRGSFIQVCSKSVSQGQILRLPREGNPADATPELGGRKVGIGSDTGPR